MDAVRLFSTENEARARDLAGNLSRLNKERQDITEKLFEEVRSQIEREGTGRHLYVAHGSDWPEGIIGLVAGKLQERYHRPVVLMTDGDEFVKGSARSIPGFSIVNAIASLSGLLVTFGGHDQAAGFSLESDKVEEFSAALEKQGEEKITEDMLTREITADVCVNVSDIGWDLLDTIQKMQPFGYGNRRPVFWVKEAIIDEARGVGDGSHMKYVLRDEGGGETLDGIYFRAHDEAKELAPGDAVEVIGNVEKNTWNGKETVQFKVIEIAAAIK
jgi:single-stranded-DNA-specific exonuclease